MAFLQQQHRPVSARAAVNDSLPPCTTCADFCDGKCSFAGPSEMAMPLGVRQNLTVTRYTPADVAGLTDKDSGDAAGDLYFGLEELITPMHCRRDPSYFKCQNGTGRYLYYNDTYVRYTVEFDGVFGPYSACNPVQKNDWTCASPCGSHQMCPGLYTTTTGGGEGPPDAATCGAASCTRSRTAVGWLPKKVSHAPCHPAGPCDRKPLPPGPFPAAGFELQSLVGGNWYSTRHEGECTGAARPGDGSGCTWRLLPGAGATKSVKCVHTRVLQVVLARNSSCFGACPDGADPLPASPSDCWTNCTFATILGTWNGATGTPGITAAELVGTFDNAMAPAARGGCPDLLPPSGSAQAYTPHASPTKGGDVDGPLPTVRGAAPS